MQCRADAIGFGSKVGSGLGSVILSAFLAIGGYQASLESATASMRYSIYGFSNYLPLVVNLAMFLIFTRFDLEEKITKDAGRSTCEKREKNKRRNYKVGTGKTVPTLQLSFNLQKLPVAGSVG